MKPQKSLLALTVAACITLGGCTLSVSDGVLHPPKTTGREAEIQRLIEIAADGPYTMKYPKTGQFRSAIIAEDLDGDGGDEAISFYRRDSDSAVTQMLVMSDTDGKWQQCGSFSIDCSDIDSVRFADCNYDGVEEIFVGCVRSTATNELQIFKYNAEKHSAEKIDYNIPYSGFAIGDYDRDGSNEILSMTAASAESKAKAVLTDYNNNKLVTLSSCTIDDSVLRYERITSGLIDGETIGVAVDGTLEAGYNTQVIYYDTDERGLVCFPHSTGKHPDEPITRDYAVFCEDINGDGYVEIPTAEASSVESDSGEIAPIVTWCRFAPDKLSLKETTRCISSFDFNFSFILPENLVGNAAATISKDKRVLSVYSVNNGKTDTLLLTLKVFDIDTPTDKMSGYSALESYNQYIYTYKIEDDSIYYIDDDTIKNNFMIHDSSQSD